MNEFFKRLKERKLVQWTLAYVAAAFALLQGIDIMAQRFDWPEETMRFVIIALSVGFFVTWSWPGIMANAAHSASPGRNCSFLRCCLR